MDVEAVVDCYIADVGCEQNLVHVALVEVSGKKSLECLLHEKLIHFDCHMQLVQYSESLIVLRKVPCQVHCLHVTFYVNQLTETRSKLLWWKVRGVG